MSHNIPLWAILNARHRKSNHENFTKRLRFNMFKRSIKLIPVYWKTLPSNPWYRHGIDKMAVAFANVFMVKDETKTVLHQRAFNRYF